jgi:hypothetical protein
MTKKQIIEGVLELKVNYWQSCKMEFEHILDYPNDNTTEARARLSAFLMWYGNFAKFCDVIEMAKEENDA